MRAFVVTHDDGSVDAGVREVDEASLLTSGDVVVALEWSCLNFKDAMVVQPNSRVARLSPLIAGVDGAGVVVSSTDGSLAPGTPVVAHGHGFGTSHHGGFAPTLRCDASWLTRLPEGLTTRTAMVFGTAGYTAMASLLSLRDAGVEPGGGEVLVTGATGGVGSVAVALLSSAGYEVTAMTGKQSEHDALRALGAAHVIDRDGLSDKPDRVLGAERFAGAVDCVGGATLAGILRVLRWGGAVVSSGLVGGAELQTTVYPFITRNVSLLGIDSVLAPPAQRTAVWGAIAGALDESQVERLVGSEIGLDGISAALATLDRGDARGRVLVRPSE